MEKKTKHSSFTLIELMMVMGIIAVLAMLALPMYTNYVGRAQVSEAIQMAASIKPEVEGAFAANGSLPISVSLPQGSGNAGRYVDTLSVDQNGIITATISQQAATPIQGKQVTLTPSFAPSSPDFGKSGNTTWVCGGTVESHFLPVSCKRS